MTASSIRRAGTISSSGEPSCCAMASSYVWMSRPPKVAYEMVSQSSALCALR